MKTIHGQVLTSTSIDSQGEQLTKTDLVELLGASPDPLPLNYMHDMGKQYCGIARNLRIEQDESTEDLYYLKADVEMEDELFDALLKSGRGGFSWSLTVKLGKNYEGDEHPEVMIYLPWPFYNDKELISRLLASPQRTLVGKWVKKGAEPTLIALIASPIMFILGPIWQGVYDRHIAPSIRNSYEQLKVLWDKRMSTVHFFQTQYGDNLKCFIFLNPDQEHPIESCAVANIKKGINIAVTLLQDRIDGGREPIRCHMRYELAHDLWVPVSIQYRGGTYENFNGDA
jgi:hypothetical protein